MAKSQKRSNREIRKPKTVKAPVAATTASLFTKGQETPIKKSKG